MVFDKSSGIKIHKSISDIWENLYIDSISVKFLGYENSIVVM